MTLGNDGFSGGLGFGSCSFASLPSISAFLANNAASVLTSALRPASFSFTSGTRILVNNPFSPGATSLPEAIWDCIFAIVFSVSFNSVFRLCSSVPLKNCFMASHELTNAPPTLTSAAASEPASFFAMIAASAISLSAGTTSFRITCFSSPPRSVSILSLICRSSASSACFAVILPACSDSCAKSLRKGNTFAPPLNNASAVVVLPMSSLKLLIR